MYNPIKNLVEGIRDIPYRWQHITTGSFDEPQNRVPFEQTEGYRLRQALAAEAGKTVFASPAADQFIVITTSEQLAARGIAVD